MRGLWKLLYYGLFWPTALGLRWLRIIRFDSDFTDQSKKSYWTEFVDGSTVGKVRMRVKRKVYRPHPYTLFELQPNFVSADGLTKHNYLGFRGPNVTFQKKCGVPRIVCMGESTTYCTGIRDDSKTYPAKLGSYLKVATGREVEVVNAGLPGSTSLENLLRFVFKVQPLNPDLVVFYFTHNDVHPRRLPYLGRDYREYSRIWSARKETLRGGNQEGDIASFVRETKFPVGQRPAANVFHNPENFFRDNIFSLACLASGWGIRVLFLLPPYKGIEVGKALDPTTSNPVSWAVMQHRQAVCEVSARFGMESVDLACVLPMPKASRFGEQGCFLDAVHFSEEGADLVGRIVAQRIFDLGYLAKSSVDKPVRGIPAEAPLE